jgi:transposase InsO family protein
VTRYHHVDAMKAEGFPVRAACVASEISSSSYYAWKDREARGPSVAEQAEDELVGLMKAIHDDSDSTYGAPRVHRELRRRGYCVNHKRVERLMRIHELVAVTERRRIRTTIPAEDALPLPDLVGRRFAPGAPDVAWAGDITYIATNEGWLFLSSVLDLGSRRLIGWSMDDNMATPLVADALRNAVRARGGNATGVIFHSDRGSQYLSEKYRALCDSFGIRQSAGRVATCLLTG